ncbi:MAG: hypothetical protein VKP62_01335 [Candidatus Sericytochromatia bacterium]|nr:hypothetical protein [Candidatus Sericytochromatia bacterium]
MTGPPVRQEVESVRARWLVLSFAGVVMAAQACQSPSTPETSELSGTTKKPKTASKSSPAANQSDSPSASFAPGSPNPTASNTAVTATPTASATAPPSPTPTPIASTTQPSTATGTQTTVSSGTQPVASQTNPILYTGQAFSIEFLAGGQIDGNPTTIVNPKGDTALIGKSPEGIGMAPMPLAGATNVLVHYTDPAYKTLMNVNPAGAVGWGGTGDPDAQNSTLNKPRGLAYDPKRGALYIADSFLKRIVRLTFPKTATDTLKFDVIAGNANTPPDAAYLDGPGASATLMEPHGLLLINDDLYFADAGYHSIRKVNVAAAPYNVEFVAGGKSTTPGVAVAGTVSASAARFNRPTALSLKCQVSLASLLLSPTLTGSIVVADTNNHCLRTLPGTVTFSTALVPTAFLLEGQVGLLAGTPGSEGAIDGPAGTARLKSPIALAADLAGHVYFGERETPRLRRVEPDGRVLTVLGSQEAAYTNAASGSLARVGAILGLAEHIDRSNGNMLGLFAYDLGVSGSAARLRYVRKTP